MITGNRLWCGLTVSPGLSQLLTSLSPNVLSEDKPVGHIQILTGRRKYQGWARDHLHLSSTSDGKENWGQTYAQTNAQQCKELFVTIDNREERVECPYTLHYINVIILDNINPKNISHCRWSHSIEYVLVGITTFLC